MFKSLSFLTIFLTLMNQSVACNSQANLNNIYAQESEKLLQNAPSFKQGWESKTIRLQVSKHGADQENCVANLTLTIPQQDIDEVNAFLAQNPAKRILLAAQGYQVLNDTNTSVDYFYQVHDGEIVDKNKLNQTLSQFHSSIEYMYQQLAQIRATVPSDSKNTIQWSAKTLEDATNTCLNTTFFTDNTNSNCACRVKKLTQIISPKQMELINFIETQPYAIAAGALSSYYEHSHAINDACGIKSAPKS